MKNFIGIEIRSVLIENEEYKSFYVDKESILSAYPDTDFSDVDNIFFHACEYLENYGKDVVSCETSKINTIYQSAQ